MKPKRSIQLMDVTMKKSTGKSLQNVRQVIFDYENQIEKILAKVDILQKDQLMVLGVLKRYYEERDKLLARIRKNDWGWILEEDQFDTDVKKKLRDKKLSKLGISSNGFYPEIKQTALRVSLIRGDKTSYLKTVKALKTILPYLRPLPEDGVKHVQIFEGNLASRGVYEMLIRGNAGSIIIQRTVYSQLEIIKKFKSLESAVKYIQENLYYEYYEDKGE